MSKSPEHLRCEATLTLDEAASRRWPAVIVGAGVAGTTAALGLLRRGIMPLILDKSSWPRAKTCGGCLNPRALAELQALGIGDLPASLGARSIKTFELRTAGRAAQLDLARAAQTNTPSSWLAVSRLALDAALLNEAIARGAQFIDHAQATGSSLELDCRKLTVRDAAGSNWNITTDCVLACGGLGDTLAKHDGIAVGVGRSWPRLHPKIGIACILPAETVGGALPGAITMLAAPGIYAGLAPVEGGAWNLAGALRAADKTASPQSRIAALLEINGVRIQPAAWRDAAWTACPQFPRAAAQPAAGRLLLVGDSAGYVEPFTGEGMAWAMASARLAAHCLAWGWGNSTAGDYARLHRRQIAGRRKLAFAAARLSANPILLLRAIQCLRRSPALGSMVLDWLCRAEAIPPF